MNITVTGLDELIERADAAGANLQPLMEAALTKSATTVQKLTREQAPHRTGNLQRSILFEVDYPIAKVNVNERYGAYVEFGTEPHIIQPKYKKALFWNGAAHPVTIVHHPGTKANPFFERGVALSKPVIKDYYVQVADSITRQLAGV